jgi:hypothetical protein
MSKNAERKILNSARKDAPRKQEINLHHKKSLEHKRLNQLNTAKLLFIAELTASLLRDLSMLLKFSATGV